MSLWGGRKSFTSFSTQDWEGENADILIRKLLGENWENADIFIRKLLGKRMFSLTRKWDYKWGTPTIVQAPVVLSEEAPVKGELWMDVLGRRTNFSACLISFLVSCSVPRFERNIVRTWGK